MPCIKQKSHETVVFIKQKNIQPKTTIACVRKIHILAAEIKGRGFVVAVKLNMEPARKAGPGLSLQSYRGSNLSRGGQFLPILYPFLKRFFCLMMRRETNSAEVLADCTAS